jgi:hypothetical protein
VEVAVTTPQHNVVFDPETIELFRQCLEKARSQLEPGQQTRVSKTVLAERILKAASNGERDPTRLPSRALIGMAPAMNNHR